MRTYATHTQTVVNAWMVVAFVREVYRTGMPLWGSRVDVSPDGWRLAFLVYAHYHNKYVEFVGVLRVAPRGSFPAPHRTDTLFMILRKKNRQISVLHVYHHSLLMAGRQAAHTHPWHR